MALYEHTFLARQDISSQQAEALVEQFKSVLVASGLSERRPIQDNQCLEGMLQYSNLTVSAWLGSNLLILKNQNNKLKLLKINILS